MFAEVIVSVPGLRRRDLATNANAIMTKMWVLHPAIPLLFLHANVCWVW